MAARVILALEWSLAAACTLTLMIALVGWARRIEEDKGKKGAESGDPPTGGRGC
jgi:hypothetical protein